ncbi:hypothetical protein Micbo1qcDRAFT_204674 [Microdochium bolleyi]|uniref:Uncharacterized protein n=1 Tax=Microdochium bolleyi TaxID=196109 RepID=A0A136J2G6_9PEZI|nr:hypothetical protein Micbo1qcDRAFT_204674 [Microdochium bolleyi]
MAGSSQIRRDGEGRLSIDIIPHGQRSSSMAAGGSISPSSLHDTEIYSTSPAFKPASKERVSSDDPDQMQLEDTIPLPRPEVQGQELLRSTPPPIPDSLRPIAAMSDVEDLSGNPKVSAEQVKEITRPPRCSSEVSTRHSELQAPDDGLSADDDEPISDGDGSDYNPYKKKKKNARPKTKGAKVAAMGHAAKDVRGAAADKADKVTRVGQQTKATSRRRRNPDANDTAPMVFEDTPAVMGQHNHVSLNYQNGRRAKEQELAVSALPVSNKANAGKKPSAKHKPKTSFFDKEKSANTGKTQATAHAETIGCKRNY